MLQGDEKRGPRGSVFLAEKWGGAPRAPPWAPHAPPPTRGPRRALGSPGTPKIFGNYFLKDFIKEKFLFKFQNLESKFKKHEFNYFLLYRFIGGIPFVIANLIPVLFNISIKNYFVGTFFGIIPQLFLIVSLGSGLDKIFQQNETVPSITDLIFSPEIYIPILGLIFIVLITIIIRKFFYKKK